MMSAAEFRGDIWHRRIAHTVIRKIVILRVRVATLDHETRNATMEGSAIPETRLGELAEPCDVLGRDLLEELALDRALLRLEDEITFRVSGELIELSARDRWFVFYLGGHGRLLLSAGGSCEKRDRRNNKRSSDGFHHSFDRASVVEHRRGEIGGFQFQFGRSARDSSLPAISSNLLSEVRSGR